MSFLHSGNNFKTIEQNAFEYLPKLEVLEISRDSLQTIGTGAFKELKMLTKLDLSGQQFDYLPEKVGGEQLVPGGEVLKHTRHEHLPSKPSQ